MASEAGIKIKDEQKGAGHRKRLRERFLQAGLEGFLDYEIVELLLTLGTPRRDCKQMAKEAINKFGSLIEVLDASIDDLQTIHGIGRSNAFGLKLFQAMSERYAKEKLIEATSLGTVEAVVSYLQKSIGREKKEHFVVLYLDSRKQLLNQEIISVGTVDASLVHAREVFTPAIRSSASAFIIGHNHPSGNPEPSEADIVITKRLSEAGDVMGIKLLDHVVISKTDSFSFKANRLL